MSEGQLFCFYISIERNDSFSAYAMFSGVTLKMFEHNLSNPKTDGRCSRTGEVR